MTAGTFTSATEKKNMDDTARYTTYGYSTTKTIENAASPLFWQNTSFR